MEKLLLLTGLTAVMAFTFIPQKDIAIKKQFAVIAVKEKVKLNTMPTLPPPLIVPIAPRKPVIKKRAIKPAMANVVKTDTVPAPKKIITNDEIRFPSISSTINDDGKTRTETTTATDQNGKKYTITKLNNQVMSLTIDGKSIPENEIKDHEPLFWRIKSAQQQNHARRQKDMEIRKADLAQRVQERKIRTDENRKRLELKNKERKEEMKERTERMGKERKEREKERAIRLKEIEGKKKAIEKKKKEIEKDGKKKIKTDSKEVIQNDINLENSKEINTDLATNMLKKQEIKQNNSINLNKESTINLQNKTEINKSLFKKTNSKLFLNKKSGYKSEVPLKPAKKEQPSKPIPKGKPVII